MHEFERREALLLGALRVAQDGSIAAVSASPSPASTIAPLTPGLIIAGKEPASEVTIAVCEAIASSGVRPKPSFRDGATNSVKRRYQIAMSSTSPRKITRSVSPAAAIFAFNSRSKARWSDVVRPVMMAVQSGYFGNSRTIASTNRSVPFW